MTIAIVSLLGDFMVCIKRNGSGRGLRLLSLSEPRPQKAEAGKHQLLYHVIQLSSVGLRSNIKRNR